MKLRDTLEDTQKDSDLNCDLTDDSISVPFEVSLLVSEHWCLSIAPSFWKTRSFCWGDRQMKQKIQILGTEIKCHPSSDAAIEQTGKQILQLNIFRNDTIIDTLLHSAHSPIKLVLINKAGCLCILPMLLFLRRNQRYILSESGIILTLQCIP